MRIIPSLILALMLTMSYFLFFRAQDESSHKVPVVASKSALATPAAPSDPYKASMDRARLAADQMNAAKAEADGIR